MADTDLSGQAVDINNDIGNDANWYHSNGEPFSRAFITYRARSMDFTFANGAKTLQMRMLWVQPRTMVLYAIGIPCVIVVNMSNIGAGGAGVLWRREGKRLVVFYF